MVGPRIYTVREAARLIPRLEEVFVRLDAVRDRLRRVKSKIEVLEMIWGEEVTLETNPDHKEHAFYSNEIAKAKAEFDETTKKFIEMEVQVKSIETGLVDFYGVIDRRLVYLCWKRGETSVDFYHHLEDGFAGRKPIESRYRAL